MLNGIFGPPKSEKKTKNPEQISSLYTFHTPCHVRTAAIARQLYIKGTVGTGRMATIYGGAANRGFKPSHTYKGNGHIARLAFQQLESMKLVEKADKGRKLSKEGQRDMDRVAASLVKSN